MTSGNLAHTNFHLKGNHPSFNDWASLAVDHQKERLYSYGGVKPYDEGNTPTCDFHCLDLRTMGWKNLTNSLRFRPQNYIPDPFLKDIEPLATRQLPAWLEPASAFISVGGGTLFLLFGGHIRDVGPTSDMIAIDLDLLTWWFVDVQGAPIRPRMSACMVAVDNKIFIFGGRDTFEENSPASPIRTYSVAQYTPQTRWTWQTADQPFPPDLPLLGYSIQATPVYGGQKIILTQGRVDDSPLDVSRESTIFFHTQNHTFQDARTTMGNFPRRGIAWYNLGSVVAGAVRPSAPPTPRRRGRPPRNPPPEIAPPAVLTMPTYNFLPSVNIVAWIKQSAQDDDLVPEAWQYSLPPAERIRCLNLREKIYDLDLDLQSFVAVGNRLFLLGSGESRDAVDAQNDDMEVDKPIPAWDVAVKISSEYLLE